MRMSDGRILVLAVGVARIRVRALHTSHCHCSADVLHMCRLSCLSTAGSAPRCALSQGALRAGFPRSCACEGLSIGALLVLVFRLALCVRCKWKRGEYVSI